MGDDILYNGVVGAPLAPAVKEAFPEIEDCVRIRRQHNVPVRIEDRDFKEKNIFIAEPAILKHFSIPLAVGNPDTALDTPFTVILDESLARKYFGEEDPMGQTIQVTLGDTFNLQVTGVMKDMPSNTVLRRPMIISFATILQVRRVAVMQWDSWAWITAFVLLREGTDIKTLEEKITALARSHLPEDEKDASYYLQPLRNIYLYNAAHGLNNDLDNTGSLTRIYIFSGIALLILIIAAINFINLSTAKIAGRMKEIGIRKTCGAVRSHLVRQFLIESILLTSIAMGLGLVFFSLFKPHLDQYLGKTLNLGILTTPWILPAVVAMIFIVGILAGSYPALFLSRFPAVVIFRSGLPSGPSRAGLRRILVSAQFFIAIVLITFTLIVLKQVRYSETVDLGFNKDDLVVLRNQDAYRQENASLLKNQILNRTQVLSAASLSRFPSAQNRNIATYWAEENREEKGTIVQTFDSDEDFVSTMELEIVDGRAFEAGRASDKKAVLINETAVQKFGLTDPVGKFLYQEDDSFQIIGVLKDWKTNSIHSRIYAIVIQRSDESASDLLIRFPSGQNTAILSQIREVWNGLFPGQIFEYAYVDDMLFQAYGKERQLAALLISFCQLTVFVACLGIFGLASYSTEQRTKEIGVRKVLGASISSLFFLMTQNYARWIFAANILAWPVVYFVVSKWLQSYAFRTEIGIGPFIIAGFLTLAVALLSVIYQTLKAALSDPVKSLRYE
jgi:putative ABC transport system permease protein